MYVLTIIHLGIVFIILFGWAFPEITYLYGFCLITTALSWIFFDRCILVDAEQWLRLQTGMTMEHKEASFTGTFLNNVFRREVLSDKTIRILGTIILIISITYWIFEMFL